MLQIKACKNIIKYLKQSLHKEMKYNNLILISKKKTMEIRTIFKYKALIDC